MWIGIFLNLERESCGLKKCPDTCGQGPCKNLCRGISISDFASFDSYDYFSEGNADLIDSQILNACQKQ